MASLLLIEAHQACIKPSHHPLLILTLLSDDCGGDDDYMGGGDWDPMFCHHNEFQGIRLSSLQLKSVTDR